MTTFSEADWQSAIDQRDLSHLLDGGFDRWRSGEEEVTLWALRDPAQVQAWKPGPAAFAVYALSEARVREPIFYRLFFGQKDTDFDVVRANLREIADLCPDYALAPVAATLAVVEWHTGSNKEALFWAMKALSVDSSNNLSALIAKAVLSGLSSSAWLAIIHAFGLEALRSGSETPANPALLSAVLSYPSSPSSH